MLLRPSLALAALLLCSRFPADAAPPAKPRAQSSAAAPAAPLTAQEQYLQRAMEAANKNLSLSSASYGGLSAQALQKLFQKQDAAWRKLPAGSFQRALAAEDAAQIAAAIGWKRFDQNDLEQGKIWFARRSDLRSQAYSTRRALIGGQLQEADRRRQAFASGLASAYATLKRQFPTLHARLSSEAKKAELPLQPVEFRSSIALQMKLFGLQAGERAAWKKATAAKNTQAATQSFRRYMTLQQIVGGLGGANGLRSLRWTLAAQRQVLARHFGRDSDLLLFAQQDLSAHRSELQRERAVVEPEELVLAKQGEVAHALDNVSGAHATLGQVERALGEQEEAIALRRSLPRWHPASSLVAPFQSVGKIYMDLGQVRRALDFYLKAQAEIGRERALRQALTRDAAAISNQDAELDFSEGMTLNNIAVLKSWAGDHQGALEILERARQRFSNVPGKDFNAYYKRALLATTLNNRAAVLSDSGQYQETAAAFEAVASERRALGDDTAAATALANAAGAYDALGQGAKARQYANQARVLYAGMPLGVGQVAILNYLCNLERREGNLAEAEALGSQTMRAALALGDIGWVATAQRSQARLLLARKRPAEALQVLAATHALDEKVGAPISTSSTFELEGDALAAQVPANAAPDNATRAAAIEKYKVSIALVEQVRARSVGSVFLEQQPIFQPYQSLAPLLIQAGRADEAFDILARARSKALMDSLRLDSIETKDAALQVLLQRVQSAQDKLHTAQAALQSEQARPASERDAGKIATLKGLLAKTQAEFDALSATLRARNPNFDRVIAVQPTLLKSAQKDIPLDTALVQYAPLGEQLYIFVVTRESLKVFASPTAPSELFGLVRRFRTLMEQAREKLQDGDSLAVEDWGQNSTRDLRDNLKALYAALVAPIESEVASKGTLAFIPTQSLFYLPMQALAHDTPSGLRFLIQDKRISYLATADVMNVVKARSNNLGTGVISLGNPKGAELPFAGEEAQSVARIFSEARQAAQFISGSEATKQALLAPANRNRRVWHLATHGVLNQASPTNSYIQLAPAAKGGDTDASKLTIKEVWGLDLKKLDLVTLSACQTALGQRDPDGFEITSLANSFAGAGAKSVLASLWSVADDSTSTLMSRFYRSMADGHDKARSLQDAELALMQNPETRHPFFWAPFVLLGDWR